MKNPTEYVQDDWPNDADTVPRRRGFDIEQMRSVRASRIQRDIDRPIIVVPLPKPPTVESGSPGFAVADIEARDANRADELSDDWRC